MTSEPLWLIFLWSLIIMSILISQCTFSSRTSHSMLLPSTSLRLKIHLLWLLELFSLGTSIWSLILTTVRSCILQSIALKIHSTQFLSRDLSSTLSYSWWSCPLPLLFINFSSILPKKTKFPLVRKECR